MLPGASPTTKLGSLGVIKPTILKRVSLLFALSVSACTAPQAPVQSTSVVAGDYRLLISDEPRLELFRRDESLLRFEAGGFQLGVLPSLSDDVVYDPYRPYDPTPLYTVPDELHYLSPDSARFHPSETGVELELRYPEGQQALLRAEALDDGRFKLELKPVDASRVGYLRLAPRASASEGFYGLGEYFDDVNHRGHVRAMQIEVPGANTPKLESSYNEAHVPVPFLIGTNGWGLFVQSAYPAAFAVAAKPSTELGQTPDPELIEATFGTGLASGTGLQFFLYGAEHPLDLTRHYFATTGLPRLPARWALGPWIWRDENEDQAQIEKDLDTIRDLDLATTGYWIDRPYATAVNTFDFSSEMFSAPATMMNKMRALGFRTALWHTPYLDEKAQATTELRSEAEAEGYYPKQAGPNLNKWGRPIDLTNPEAVAWWQDKLASYLQLGIEGFKLDYMEDILAGIATKRFKWLFSDGSDERTQHSQFQKLYHKTYGDVLPADGGFLLCRGGTYGDQRNGVIVWPGDLDANMLKHGEIGQDKDGADYLAVGGLPASLVAALSLGPSGFLFYGADTGGYRHCPPDNETFSRWFEQTALSTVMQVGTSCNDVAWEPTPQNGFDAALLDRYRGYARLHLRLFPYIYSHAQQARDTGRPIMRALGLAHPELGIHPNDIYLLGDALLVAPVVARGATSRQVSFPQGRWLHWFTGETIDVSSDGLSKEIDAPIGRLPLFLRHDRLVPMLRPTIDTLSPASDADRVDSYASDSGILYAWAIASSTASFDLFDGSRLAMANDGKLSFEAGNEFKKGAIFRLHTAQRPSLVTQAGTSLAERNSPQAIEAEGSGWFFDEKTAQLWVFVGPSQSVQFSS
jgi:alpha-D-xyloside xylohydrolase